MTNHEDGFLPPYRAALLLWALGPLLVSAASAAGSSTTAAVALATRAEAAAEAMRSAGPLHPALGAQIEAILRAIGDGWRGGRREEGDGAGCDSDDDGVSGRGSLLFLVM